MLLRQIPIPFQPFPLKGEEKGNLIPLHGGERQDEEGGSTEGKRLTLLERGT